MGFLGEPTDEAMKKPMNESKKEPAERR